MTAQDTAGLVACLRAQTTRINGLPLNTNASDLCRAAADALEAMGRELAERNDEIVGERWHADEAARQRDVWKERATTAERLLSESQAEGRRLREALEEIARQKFTRELRSEFGRDYETDWEGGYDACIRRARTTLSSSIGPEKLCLHAPTYDAGLCCGHPDDCTFVSPTARAARDEGDGR